MEKVLRFKTTINCPNCIRAVTGFLNEVPQVTHWEVDTDHPEKILKVTGDHVEVEAVVEAVEDAGFDILFLQD